MARTIDEITKDIKQLEKLADEIRKAGDFGINFIDEERIRIDKNCERIENPESEYLAILDQEKADVTKFELEFDSILFACKKEISEKSAALEKELDKLQEGENDDDNRR